MAKPIRTTTDSLDSWGEWVQYAQENKVVEYSNQDTQRAYAEEHGVSLDVAKQALHDEYYDARRTFYGYLDNKREASAQIHMIRNNNLDSTCAVYQRADRILTGLSVEVEVSDDTSTDIPAWNDGKTITFNSSAIKAVDDNTVLSLHGLNYHEVAHLLFTPRSGTALGKWVTEQIVTEYPTEWTDTYGDVHKSIQKSSAPDQQRLRAFNVLEDCRAENYLVLKYPSVKPFLINLLGDYILEHPEQLADAFILLGGRRYFSRTLRQQSALAYAEVHGVDKAQRLFAILSEYRSLVFPKQYARAQELITALLEFMPDFPAGTPSGCGDRAVPRNGRPTSEKSQQALLDSDKSGDDKLEFGSTDAWSEESSGDNGTSKPTDTATWRDKDEALMEQIKQTVERAKTDKSVTDKVRETNKAIAKSTSSKSILAKKSSHKASPEAREVLASRLFGQELERIRIDADPAWEREKPSGKLNVRRAMHADINDYGKLFDRWETGNDDYDIEACILLDRSGSMYNEIGAVCRSAWVIKRGIEKINGRVTLMTFNDASHVLSHADERADSSIVLQVDSAGGTNPFYALTETERLFMQSTRKTKLMFLLTDGGFATESDIVIERLNGMGVHTNLVYLTANERWANEILKDKATLEQRSHKAQNFRVISKPADLLTVAKDVVRHHLKKVGK